MACMTTCTNCARLYQESSEEAANDPNRLCLDCFDKASDHAYECKCGLCQKWRRLVPEEQ
jgi:hypothetical protein